MMVMGRSSWLPPPITPTLSTGTPSFSVKPVRHCRSSSMVGTTTRVRASASSMALCDIGQPTRGAARGAGQLDFTARAEAIDLADLAALRRGDEIPCGGDTQLRMKALGNLGPDAVERHERAHGEGYFLEKLVVKVERARGDQLGKLAAG